MSAELNNHHDHDLERPQLPFADPSPGSEGVTTANASRASLTQDKAVASPAHTPGTELPPATVPAADKTGSAAGRRKWIIAGVLALIVILVLVIVLPVYYLVVRPKNQTAAVVTNPGNGGGPAPSGSAAPPAQTGTLLIGGDGSTVNAAEGPFVYSNKFGGYWVEDSANPYNDGARPQLDIPALNQSWRFGVDIIQGVNLGGWLITEPFVAPALYQKYPTATDEYELSLAMRADTANGGINQLEDHYRTFITEKDFAEIAGAGLNWVRLPIPYWAIEVWDGEPFLEGVAWKYALKAFKWARKYGIRINLDLHTAPGSQNTWLHSGRGGHPNWLTGPMGYANAERTLDYIRIITEFISQDQYKNLIPMFGIVNEPVVDTTELQRFYYQAHQVVRSVTGLGAGKGPFISIHDKFDSLSSWAGFLAGSDRVALDNHPYFAFGGPSTDPLSAYIQRPCDSWGGNINASMAAFGFTAAGEWSLGWNDCGLYVNGVTQTSAYPGGCTSWNTWETWTQETKDQLKQFAGYSMSALQNSFFWTWKIGPAADGHVEAPFWSYKLGLDNGWIPKNPRDAFGLCPSVNPYTSATIPTWALGGAGAGQFIGPVTQYQAWPPAGSAYLYTPNRPIIKLQGEGGNGDGTGWTNAADTTPLYGKTPGCDYPNAWAEGGGAATAACATPGR